MLILALLFQATAEPDIQLNVDATVRRVRIQSEGTTSLRVAADPDAGSRATTEVAPRVRGRREARNVRVRVRAEARIADPGRPSDTQAQ